MFCGFVGVGEEGAVVEGSTIVPEPWHELQEPLVQLLQPP
jgi:hypothetical protein